MNYGVYFRPDFVLNRFADGSADLSTMPGPMLVWFFVEIAKWCTVLAIAVWLTYAQVVAWRRGKKTTAPDAGSTTRRTQRASVTNPQVRVQGVRWSYATLRPWVRPR